MADLFVISRSDAPGQLMIGASRDPQMRAQCLQNCQSFYVHVVATLRHQGRLKSQVYKALRYCRCEGPSREWHNCSLSDVLHVLARLVGDEADPESDDIDDE
jgi:hypothetical protein